MPELPEVETVRRDLCRLVCGRVVTRVEILDKRLLIGTTTPARLKRALAGAEIAQVERVGKLLILRFSSGWSLLVHFRMTGQLYPLEGEAELPSHTRTVLHLDDGRKLVHVDLRRLGTLELTPTSEEGLARSLSGIGPDALEAPPAAEDMMAALARRRIPVKQLLLNQEFMSGIGNIYACEALARARIAPGARCCDITLSQARRLLAAIREVLTEAITLRGTTISDYRTGTGEPGRFRDALRVYGREGDKCRKRGCGGVIERMAQGQRSTYYCPRCQRSSE